MLENIRTELERVGAAEICVMLDDEFEPQASELVKVESQDG